MNFTVDVLGASVNLLETAARFEGFETLIEQMFGPEGYFPDDRLMQLLKIKPTEAVSRDKRSAAEDEMNEIKTNLEKLQDKVYAYINLFINSDAILNRDALWSIQGNKHYLQAAIVERTHHTGKILRYTFS